MSDKPEHPVTTVKPIPTRREAIKRVRHYLEMRKSKPFRGMDPDLIHGIHSGTKWEAELLLSDLYLIVGFNP